MASETPVNLERTKEQKNEQYCRVFAENALISGSLYMHAMQLHGCLDDESNKINFTSTQGYQLSPDIRPGYLDANSVSLIYPEHSTSVYESITIDSDNRITVYLKEYYQTNPAEMTKKITINPQEQEHLEILANIAKDFAPVLKDLRENVLLNNDFWTSQEKHVIPWHKSPYKRYVSETLKKAWDLVVSAQEYDHPAKVRIFEELIHLHKARFVEERKHYAPGISLTMRPRDPVQLGLVADGLRTLLATNSMALFATLIERSRSGGVPPVETLIGVGISSALASAMAILLQKNRNKYALQKDIARILEATGNTEQEE